MPLLIFLALVFSQTESAFANADALLQIVEQCIDQSKPGYCERCSAPRSSANCSSKTVCKKSTEVWDESEDFVAIRDIKMCGCSDSFVHGLVMPKFPVTGVEDPRRPDEIWAFAWNVAIHRMDEFDIALAVNSKNKRTQNQLHVHIVRLKSGITEKLKHMTVGYTTDLNQIWSIAAKAAEQAQMKEYGVMVTASEHGRFAVVITAESPEGQYTHAVCHP